MEPALSNETIEAIKDQAEKKTAVITVAIKSI